MKLTVNEAVFAGWVADAKTDVPARVAALRVLADRRAKALPAAVAVALADPAPLLRAEARDAVAATDPARAAGLFAALLPEAASTVERQRAVAALAGLKKDGRAAKLLDGLAEDLAKGAVAPTCGSTCWTR